MDLDPNNNMIVLGFEYALSYENIKKLKSDYQEYKNRPNSSEENADIFNEFLEKEYWSSTEIFTTKLILPSLDVIGIIWSTKPTFNPLIVTALDGSNPETLSYFTKKKLSVENTFFPFKN